MAARGELCSATATIRYLGTMPNAQSRIPTHYAPAPCGSVTRIARKDLEKYHLRDARAIRASFSLILGLVDDQGLSVTFDHVKLTNVDTITLKEVNGKISAEIE